MFADWIVVAIGQRAYEVVQTDRSCRGDDLFQRCVRSRVAEVFDQTPRENTKA